MKKILIVLIALVLGVVLSGCNAEAVGVESTTYNRAIVSLPDGSVVSGRLEKYSVAGWSRIRVWIDGIEYFADTRNVVLIAE